MKACAEGGTRTLTLFPATDFESVRAIRGGASTPVLSGESHVASRCVTGDPHPFPTPSRRLDTASRGLVSGDCSSAVERVEVVS